MISFQRFYLDREKDLVVDLFMDGEQMRYLIRTPNHHTGNLITNLARLCQLSVSEDERGLKVIRGVAPCYVDGNNQRLYILRLGNTKVANIYPDGRVELKAGIPAISKTLMSQTKDYRLGIEKTIVKTYIRNECKFRTDLHTHMNGNLPPDILMALGLAHQIRYPLYYIRKLGLKCSEEQERALGALRAETEARLGETGLEGKHRERRINDLTFINFAELILGNPEHAQENLDLIRNSLMIPKDGQAVFADLEKVYLYRYVFTKGKGSETRFPGINPERIPDRDVREYLARILRDRQDDRYRGNTLYQDLLLWIAREYQRYGIRYAEISDTSLVNPLEFPDKLRQIHEIMPSVTRETGVLLRFLAGIRRIPLTIIRDRITPNDYLNDNLRCVRVIAEDPYVAGIDIIGEEVNDILELRGMIRELVHIAETQKGFVIRIHAGENDGLRDNVANSIRCVAEVLREGQEVPPLRIGHGLYTCDLMSAKGRRLLEEMRKYKVTLEFQITSNVRLNNLSQLDRHPLRQYLKAGVRCVQGTDGSALYGTHSIDEELSLEKLLGLTEPELLMMRQAEDEILEESLLVFGEKREAFRRACPGGDPELYYQKKWENTERTEDDLWREGGRISAEQALKDQIEPLPKHLKPVIVCGGSFHSSGHHAHLREEDKAILDALTERADPEKICFVVGHSMSAQEGYLVRRAKEHGFRVFAIVPNRITGAEKNRLQASKAGIVISIESSGMGLYKSFSYEIFKRKPSVLLAFGGNHSALNLIQEARNARKKCRIYVNPRCRGLAAKARMLEGYIQPLTIESIPEICDPE